MWVCLPGFATIRQLGYYTGKFTKPINLATKPNAYTYNTKIYFYEYQTNKITQNIKIIKFAPCSSDEISFTYPKKKRKQKSL